MCYDSNLAIATCDQCFGTNGNDALRTRDGAKCFVVMDDNELQLTACPGDPAPSKLPDGSDTPAEVAGGILNTFCMFVGQEPPLELATWLACYMFALYQDGDILYSEMVGITGMYTEMAAK